VTLLFLSLNTSLLIQDLKRFLVSYGGDAEEYFTFITPEAYYEIEKWMNYRKDSGEVITAESWVMRNVWI
jgi:hypothetical protein